MNGTNDVNIFQTMIINTYYDKNSSFMIMLDGTSGCPKANVRDFLHLFFCFIN